LIARLVVLLLLASVASVATAEPKQPTGKWVVNFDAAQCVATRNYGSATSPLYLVLKAPPLGEVLQIGIIRSGQFGEPRQIDGELIFDQNAPIRTNLLEFGVKQLKQRVLVVNLPLQSLAPMRTAPTLTIRARQEVKVNGSRINQASVGTDEHFALTQMASLLKTLERCVADLRKVWNVSQAADTISTLKERAKGNLAQFFSNDDYPAVAIEEEQSGTVVVALLVDEAGRVADCTVIETSGVAALDAQTCAALRTRAKLTPAVGADGKPAKDALISRIRWVIPGR
jgi:TonB family protein